MKINDLLVCAVVFTVAEYTRVMHIDNSVWYFHCFFNAGTSKEAATAMVISVAAAAGMMMLIFSCSGQ